MYRQVYGGTAPGGRNAIASLRPLLYDRSGNEPMEAAVSRWTVGVAAIVLLIACANVANLLLARGLQRRREIALRAALGMSPARLGRLLLAEVLLLATAGGLAALLVAHLSGSFIRSALLPDVLWGGGPLNSRVMMFSAAATGLAALLVAVLPVGQALRLRMTDAFREGPQLSRRRSAALRYGLTVFQAALSVILLVGAGLFVQSLVRVQGLDLGIEPDHVLTVRLSWKPVASETLEQRRAENARRQAVTEQAVHRLAALPGVRATSSAVGLPFQGLFGVYLRAPGVDALPELAGGGPFVSAVGAGYFETVGTEIVRGRPFTAVDGPGTERVAIVNETMARTLWPQEDPLDKCLIIESAKASCSRVVGVAEDTRRFALREEPAMQYYIPAGQVTSISGTSVLVRPSEAGADLASALRHDLFALDSTLAYVTVSRLQDELDPQVRPWRLGTSLFMSFGALALVIAVVGLYTIVAYMTAQRTQEFAIRLALGARQRDLIGLVVRHGLVVASGGVGLGVLLALAAGPSLEPLLFDTSARSPAVFLTVTVLLTAAASLASLLPARRATRTDPLAALKRWTG